MEAAVQQILYNPIKEHAVFVKALYITHQCDKTSYGLALWFDICSGKRSFHRGHTEDHRSSGVRASLVLQSFSCKLQAGLDLRCF